MYEVEQNKPVVGKRDILSTDNMCLCEGCFGDEEEEKKEARNKRRRELYQLKKAEKKAMEAGEKTASEIVANGFH